MVDSGLFIRRMLGRSLETQRSTELVQCCAHLPREKTGVGCRVGGKTSSSARVDVPVLFRGGSKNPGPVLSVRSALSNTLAPTQRESWAAFSVPPSPQDRD
jgi:hypothetical protein